MTALKRLAKELEHLTEDPPPNISAGPNDENDLYVWRATILGPEDTPYAGGLFKLEMNFSQEYPFRAPKIRFKTNIFHPNINNQGEICLDILRDKWSAAYTIRTILLSISSLFSEPNPDDPLVPEIANLYKNNNARFVELAVKYTKENAK